MDTPQVLSPELEERLCLHVDSHKDRLVEIIQDLVRIPSQNTPPVGTEQACQEYVARLDGHAPDESNDGAQSTRAATADEAFVSLNAEGVLAVDVKLRPHGTRFRFRLRPECPRDPHDGLGHDGVLLADLNPP